MVLVNIVECDNVWVGVKELHDVDLGGETLGSKGVNRAAEGDFVNGFEGKHLAEVASRSTFVYYAISTSIYLR